MTLSSKLVYIYYEYGLSDCDSNIIVFILIHEIQNREAVTRFTAHYGNVSAIDRHLVGNVIVCAHESV